MAASLSWLYAKDPLLSKREKQQSCSLGLEYITDPLTRTKHSAARGPRAWTAHILSVALLPGLIFVSKFRRWHRRSPAVQSPEFTSHCTPASRICCHYLHSVSQAVCQAHVSLVGEMNTLKPTSMNSCAHLLGMWGQRYEPQLQRVSLLYKKTRKLLGQLLSETVISKARAKCSWG